jgi:Na+/proline symporter
MSLPNQPFLNFGALLRSLVMWTLIWGAVVAFVVYQNQPGVLCMTPMAWLLALPAGWNYTIFSRGRPGRSPFIAGAILGAILGLLFGLLFWVGATYAMPVGTDPDEIAKMQNMVLFILAGGMVIAALLSGLMARRAAVLQGRGQELPTITVR